MKEKILNKTNHKTLFILIPWLVFVFTFLILQGCLATAALSLPYDQGIIKLPLETIITITTTVCLAYVGLDQAGRIKTAYNAPLGDYGQPWTPPLKSKTFIITMISFALLLELLIIQAWVGELLKIPLENALILAGTVSVAYISGEKLTTVAARSERENRNNRSMRNDNDMYFSGWSGNRRKPIHDKRLYQHEEGSQLLKNGIRTTETPDSEITTSEINEIEARR